MILGVDLGNYNVKTSEGIIFQSKVTEEERLFNDSTIVEYNGKVYTINEGEFQTDLNKSEKENFMVLLLSAVALSTKDITNHVVLGMPVQHFKSNKDKIKDMVMNNRINNIKVNGDSRDIMIVGCEVFPEGVAAYYSLDEEHKRNLGNRDVILIDIGGRTTDICIFKHDGKKRKIEKPQTVYVGMINIYSDFISAINARFTLNKELEEAEKILKNGLYLFDEKQDLSFTRPIVKKHIDKILKELNINYPIQTEKVILTGGGSYLLGGFFKMKIPNLTILDNPLFSNAIGFKKVGENIWSDVG